MIEKIKKLVELAYLSAYLTDDKPICLMLVAPPENSKTHFLLGFKSHKSHISTDLSFAGLVNILMRNKGIKQIVIGDFLKITGKKQSTKNNLLTILNSYTEEGIFDINLGNRDEQNLKGRKGGILTATTTKSFAQNKKTWEALGFSSRFLVVKYKYSDETMDKVLDKIIENKKQDKPINLKIKTGNVECDEEFKKQLKQLANRSPRKLKILLTLLKTISLKNKHKKVCKMDFEELLELKELLHEQEVTI